MRLDEARRFALSLPEATEAPHCEKSSGAWRDRAPSSLVAAREAGRTVTPRTRRRRKPRPRSPRRPRR